MQVKLVLSIETKDVVKDFVKDVVKDFVKGIPQEFLKELTERQLVILDMIASDSTISAKAISEKISEKTSEKKVVTDRTIENDIAKIKELGILRRKGGRKNGEWEIVLDFKDIDK
jgi:ATP-dependent DNA helicase RecG